MNVKTDMYELMQGDCLELMKLIPDGSVDLCVSDIPYKLTGGGKGDGINSKSMIGFGIRRYQAECVMLKSCQ